MHRRAGWTLLAAALVVGAVTLAAAGGREAPCRNSNNYDAAVTRPYDAAVAGYDSHASKHMDKAASRLSDATQVYQELVRSPDRGVPQNLVDRCRCVAVFPNVLKAAIGVGARHGQGVMSCRTSGGWSAPAFLKITGGSTGLQIGASSTDLVLFFMSDRGARSLIQGSRFTLGGKASVAAGPFGRSGEFATNPSLRSEIYSYARSRGLFAGVSLEGARITNDRDEQSAFYGTNVSTRQLLFGNPTFDMPQAADQFRSTLESESRAGND